MTSPPRIDARPALSGPMSSALAFDAPYVVEKLVKNHVADNPDEAELLFREAKRYIVLAQADPSTAWPMFSLRVDEAWHQLVLFTVEYADFCERFFGRFVHHAPSNAPRTPAVTTRPRATFADFQVRYGELFGCVLPEVWYDEKTVTADRRLVNESAGTLEVTGSGDMVDLVRTDGTIVFRVSAFARESLTFIAQTGAFHVREIPGDLTAAERVTLASELVSARVLRACG